MSHSTPTLATLWAARSEKKLQAQMPLGPGGKLTVEDQEVFTCQCLGASQEWQKQGFNETLR